MVPQYRSFGRLFDQWRKCDITDIFNRRRLRCARLMSLLFLPALRARSSSFSLSTKASIMPPRPAPLSFAPSAPGFQGVVDEVIQFPAGDAHAAQLYVIECHQAPNSSRLPAFNATRARRASRPHRPKSGESKYSEFACHCRRNIADDIFVALRIPVSAMSRRNGAPMTMVR